MTRDKDYRKSQTRIVRYLPSYTLQQYYLKVNNQLQFDTVEYESK